MLAFRAFISQKRQVKLPVLKGFLKKDFSNLYLNSLLLILLNRYFKGMKLKISLLSNKAKFEKSQMVKVGKARHLFYVTL